MHTEPISTVDQRRPPLGPFHEVAEEMGFRVVEHFDAALGHDTTVIGLTESVTHGGFRGAAIHL